MSIFQLVFCSILLAIAGITMICQFMIMHMKDPDKFSLRAMIVCDLIIVITVIVTLLAVISNWNF